MSTTALLQIVVEYPKLKQALALLGAVAKAFRNKNFPLYALAELRVEASSITLTTNSISAQAQVVFDATIESYRQPAVYLVDIHALRGAVSGDRMTLLVYKSGEVYVTSGNVKASVKNPTTWAPSDFPQPRLDAPAQDATVWLSSLSAAIGFVHKAVEEDREGFRTGAIHLKVMRHRQLQVEGLGFSVAHRATLDTTTASEGFECLVDPDARDFIKKSLALYPDRLVTLRHSASIDSSQRVELRVGMACLLFLVESGKYPDVELLIPRPDVSVEVEAAALRATFRTLAKCSTSLAPIIRFGVTVDDGLRLEEINLAGPVLVGNSASVEVHRHNVPVGLHRSLGAVYCSQVLAILEGADGMVKISTWNDQRRHTAPLRIEVDNRVAALNPLAGSHHWELL